MCIETPNLALVDGFGCVISNHAPNISWEIDNSSLIVNNSISILWNVEDGEGDDVYVNLYLENPAFNVLIPQCSEEFQIQMEKNCFIELEEIVNISSIINAVWNLKIVVGDFNNSSWTKPMSFYLISDDFFFNEITSQKNNQTVDDFNKSKKSTVVANTWIPSILFILVLSVVIFQVLRRIQKNKIT